MPSGLLNAADQRLSDRAVKAVSEAGQSLRDEAWQLATELAPAAERHLYVSAYLLLRSDIMWDENTYDVIQMANQLGEIHERYIKAIADRQADDAVG